MKVDIIASVKLLTTEEGSRRSTPIVSEFFKCPLKFNGELFDCGIYLDKQIPLLLGSTVTVPIVFVRPELFKSQLRIGSGFTLWEGGAIAEGIVEQIIPD